MTPAEAILLGIVQGLTESQPISSSAYLVIAPALIPGFHQPSVLFDAVLHRGTPVAVFFFLRREIFEVTACMQFITGILLFLSDRVKRHREERAR